MKIMNFDTCQRHSTRFYVVISLEFISFESEYVLPLTVFYNTILIGWETIYEIVSIRRTQPKICWLCKIVAFKCWMLYRNDVGLPEKPWTMVIRSTCTFSVYDKHFTENDCVMVSKPEKTLTSFQNGILLEENLFFFFFFNKI